MDDRRILAEEGETVTLSTTAGYLAFKPGFNAVKFYCASQWRMSLSPRLVHALVYDGTIYTEYTASVIDRSTATHLPLDGMTTSEKLYLGCNEPFLGVYVDLHATNKNAVVATLDVEYCSTAVALGAAIAWTDVAGDSDGTASGGATLAQDGVYTWTLPTPDSTWKRSALGTYAVPTHSKVYWIRMTPSTTLSTTIDVEEIIPVYQNANYGYMEAGLTYLYDLDMMRNGGLVFKATSGTPTLDVSWIKYAGG